LQIARRSDPRPAMFRAIGTYFKTDHAPVPL
jgi:hypothetical protein